jgi:hypothetical protein
MATILVKPKNIEEFNLIQEILKKMKISSKVVEDKEFNAETIKAIEAVKSGKTTKVKNSKDLFEQLGI